MVNEKLRKKMTDAYTNGEYDTALKLSHKLDKQILTYSLTNANLQNSVKKKKPRKSNFSP